MKKKMKEKIDDLVYRITTAYTVLMTPRERIVDCFRICEHSDKYVLHSIHEAERLLRARIECVLNLFPMSNIAVSFEEALEDMLLNKIVYACKETDNDYYTFVRLKPSTNGDHFFQVFDHKYMDFREDSSFLIKTLNLVDGIKQQFLLLFPLGRGK